MAAPTPSPQDFRAAPTPSPLDFMATPTPQEITMAKPTPQESIMASAQNITTPTSQVTVPPNEIKKFLYARDWDEVIRIFKMNTRLYATKIDRSEETVLHVVVTHGDGDTLVKLLDAMEMTDFVATKDALKAKNEKGDTPLHCAAVSSSSLTMCKCIVRIDKNLILERNKKGETPLFLAALYGQKETFIYLHVVSSEMTPGDDIKPYWRNNRGQTILHCTIQREHFDLAFHIVHMYRGQFIADSFDEKGVSPLHVLASKPSAFKSGTHLPWWTKILYYCVVVEPLNVEQPQNQSKGWPTMTIITDEPEEKKKLPDNYRTCYDLFWFLWDLIRSVKRNKGIERISERKAGQDSSRYKSSYFPLNYATLLEYLKCSYIYICGVLGVLTDIQEAKQKHIWCEQIMNELVQQTAEYEWPDGPGVHVLDLPSEETKNVINFMEKHKTDSSPPNLKNANGDQQIKDILNTVLAKLDAQPKEIEQRLDRQQETMSALLVAAKYGVIEMVKKILEDVPQKIHDRTIDEKTILHVAVENRQPHVFMKLMNNNNIWNNLKETVDANGNNVLHMAAKLSKYKPWKIPGGAMQMQGEIKWYQYVKASVPKHLSQQANQDDETPGEIFNKSHKGLVQDANEWLKSTSESCSVVAALVAGVSYATSSQVPGGNNDKTGKPTLQGHPTFDVFAVASLVSLCFSIIALVILPLHLHFSQRTKRFSQKFATKASYGLNLTFFVHCLNFSFLRCRIFFCARR
ncbi:hypothetical protein L6164_017770 [Bauhinia variegata]|uniref:Uncharacterized protein n=1 Tax=Bauhinia variegata TaxID=167791 RepID=A0ACB9NCF8_BAUVA|nr:hypothetical protein L6164_017770 [Bauhinia variegata]